MIAVKGIVRHAILIVLWLPAPGVWIELSSARSKRQGLALALLAALVLASGWVWLPRLVVRAGARLLDKPALTKSLAKLRAEPSLTGLARSWGHLGDCWRYRPDDVSVLDSRYSRALAHLPAGTVTVGWISHRDPDQAEAIRLWQLAHYALTPHVLRLPNDLNLPPPPVLVLGDYAGAHPVSAELEALGLVKMRDLGQGLLLLRRTAK